jgi:hypothetical protein
MGVPHEAAVDRDLVERAQQGDQEAFGVLARTRSDRLVTYIVPAGAPALRIDQPDPGDPLSLSAPALSSCRSHLDR